MTRGYEIADVAAFYRAFGVEVREGSERPDHLVAELDFLHLLALKVAVAISEDNSSALDICRQAREKFLVDHVVRWVGLFCQLLNETETIGPFYPAAGRLLLVFLQEQVVTTPGAEPAPPSQKEVRS
jgi:TorA maturation chaperone TorD